MAVCGLCGKSGWLLTVDGRGLCADCSPLVAGWVLQATRASDAIWHLKTIDARLRAVADLEEACRQLATYEDRQISTLTQSPRAILLGLPIMRSAIATKAVLDVAYLARQKSKSGATSSGRTSGYTSAIGQLAKLSVQFSDVVEFAAGAALLQSELDRLRFEIAMQHSEVEIAKGKLKKASEIIIGAAMALKFDQTMDSEQHDLLERARVALRALGQDSPF